MIRLEVNNGQYVADYEITPSMTAQDLISKFQDDTNLHPGHLRFASFTLLDPSQNKAVPLDEELVDERYYHLQCWIIDAVDDSGKSLHKKALGIDG